MKAAQITEYGHADAVKVVEIDKPGISEGQVLVEVHASSLNPFDTMVREGYIKNAIAALPVTLGGDIAGIVAEVGEGVENVSIGDKVYGQANVVAGNSGALAEFAATKGSQVAKAPSNLDHVQAASLVLTGVSALQALTEHIKLQSGQKILIHGGSGGIGSIAIQLAKHIGAYVATTVSTGDVAYAKELGADEVIDYETQNFMELIRDYDAVFDTAGGDVFEQSLTALKSGGIGVSMIASIEESRAQALGVQAITQSTHVTNEALDELRELIENGAVTTHIDSVFPLEQIAQAFEKREGGQARGKIVIEIKQ